MQEALPADRKFENYKSGAEEQEGEWGEMGLFICNVVLLIAEQASDTRSNDDTECDKWSHPCPGSQLTKQVQWPVLG